MLAEIVHGFLMLVAFGTFILGLYVIRNNIKFFKMFEKKARSYSYRPSVSVIAPLRGIDEKFEENILSLLNQKYSGKWEVLFVVDPDDKKTKNKIKDIIKKSKNSRVIENVMLATCSGKSAAIITGSKAAKHDIIACYDSDVKIPENWLSALVDPLKNENVGSTTGYRFYVPRTFSGYLLSAWNTIGFIAMRKHVFTWGGSFAISKKLVKKLSIQEAWENSISDDSVITIKLKQAKLKNVFVPACIGISYPSRFSHLTEFTTRQVTIVRWYWMGAFLTGFLLYFFTRISIILGFIALYLYSITGNVLYAIEACFMLSFVLLELIRANIDFNNFSRYVSKIPSRTKWCAAYLLSQWLMAYNIVIASNKKTITWRGRKYDFSKEIKHT